MYKSEYIIYFYILWQNIGNECTLIHKFNEVSPIYNVPANEFGYY